MQLLHPLRESRHNYLEKVMARVAGMGNNGLILAIPMVAMVVHGVQVATGSRVQGKAKASRSKVKHMLHHSAP